MIELGGMLYKSLKLNGRNCVRTHLDTVWVGADKKWMGWRRAGAGYMVGGWEENQL